MPNSGQIHHQSLHDSARADPDVGWSSLVGPQNCIDYLAVRTRRAFRADPGLRAARGDDSHRLGGSNTHFRHVGTFERSPFGASHEQGHPVTALSPVMQPYRLAAFGIQCAGDGESDHTVLRLPTGFNELSAPIPAWDVSRG